MVEASSPASSTTDPLDLTSLDSESLFEALGAVERAIPDLLLSVKPVLAHLTSSRPEQTAQPANTAIETYMSTLDKIQFVLRQTVYYLRETRASTSALRPPPVNAIPTPFAASLPSLQPGTARHSSGSEISGGEEGAGGRAGEGEVQLGLYGMRKEVEVLRGLEETLRRLKEERLDDGGTDREGGGG